jgi:hypothetical protein
MAFVCRGLGGAAGLAIKVDDAMVAAFEDEQDFVMEISVNQADGAVTITLH